MNINLDIHGSKDIIYVNQNDTSEGVTFYIKDNGTAVNLTGLTVYFILKKTSYITTQLSVVSASSGTVSLTLTSAMVATSGTIVFEVVGTTANDETAFRISSYMVVQNVYSGDDGPNADDEVNPGIDVLYGEDEPDEDDGEDKDIYIKLNNEGNYIPATSEITMTFDSSLVWINDGIVKNADDSYNINIHATPISSPEYASYKIEGLEVGKKYRFEYDYKVNSGQFYNQFTNGIIYLDEPNHYLIPHDEYLITPSWYSDYNIQRNHNDYNEHHYINDFYATSSTMYFEFMTSDMKDGINSAIQVQNLTVSERIEQIEKVFFKNDNLWLEDTGRIKDLLSDGVSVVDNKIVEINTMIGATAQSNGKKGLVPTPTIADKDKVLKGDGTWGEVQGASAVTDLTDVELTNLADKEILEWDAVAEKWKNVPNSGGGIDGSIMNVIHFNWITASSRAVDTALTESITLDAGKYLFVIYTPYSTVSESTIGILGISINGIKLEKVIKTYVNYGNSVVEVALEQPSIVKLVAWQGASMTWDSQYLNRGGMDAILLSQISPVIYSEDEREIGVWTDGSRLYQKTVPTGGSAPSGATLRERTTQVGCDTIRYTK